jgi:hypothetical protein
MYPSVRSLLGVSVMVFGALAMGCDAQVSPDYVGEPLLTITGSVSIAGEHRDQELIPALGFPGLFDGPAVYVMDVQVHGSFPSDFQLDVSEPPPQGALEHPTLRTKGEPKVAVAYITAVTADHPTVVHNYSSVSVTGYLCEDARREDGLCRVKTIQECNTIAGKYECTVQDEFCPGQDSPESACVWETGTADPPVSPDAVALDTWTQFAGFSQNYQVLYFEHEAPKGSATAAWFGSTESIPAGYGLYEVRKLTEEERQAAVDCSRSDEAARHAAELYNAAHGTDYTTFDCPEAPGEVAYCLDLDDSEPEAIDERDRLWEASAQDLGCRLQTQREYTRVKHPEKESISVVIDSEVPFEIGSPSPPMN